MCCLCEMRWGGNTYAIIKSSSSSFIAHKQNADTPITHSGNDDSPIMEMSAHSDSALPSGHSTSSSNGGAGSSGSVGRLLRAKRYRIENTIHKAHHRLSLGSTSASTYAGQLSTMVFGKIRSLWTAQEDQMGLNQLTASADRTAGTKLIIVFEHPLQFL